MATFLLSEKSFDLSSTSKDFIESYIKRIKNYILLHDISETYLDDINERIIEKLSQLQKTWEIVKDSDIIKIVNDIGEPEDIFPENETHSSWEENKKPNFLKKSFERNTRKGIIFWVCAGMSDYFEIDALWIRLLFIVMTVIWGFGIVVYIALAILLPSKEKIQNKEILPEKRGIIDQLASLVGGSFRWVFRFFLILVFWLIGLGFVICFIGWVVISWFLISGSFEIGNQYLPAVIPGSLLIWAPLLTIISLIVFVAIFAGILGKNLLGRIWWILLTILSWVGFVLLATGAFNFLHEYTWTENQTQEQSFDFTGTTLQIDDLMNHQYSENIEFLNTWNNVFIQKERGRKTITIRSVTSVQARDSIAGKEIISKMNQPIYTLSGNILKLDRAVWWDFTSRIPYSFSRRNITVIIPENTTITGEFHNYDPEEESFDEEIRSEKLQN